MFPEGRSHLSALWNTGQTGKRRYHSFSYDELLKRDKVSLDLFWLRDERLEGADTLSSLHVLAASIVEDLQTALEQIMAISEDLGGAIAVNRIE